MSNAPDRSAGRYADDDREIDIGRYLFAIWRRALPIACVAVVCAVIGFAVASAGRVTYQSTAQLVVNRSKVGDNAAYNSQFPVNIASFKAMLNNQSVAAEVIRQFGLDKAPYGLTVSTFLGGVLTTQIVPETNVITVTARLPDPALAAKVANAFADRAVTLPDTLNQDDIAAARATLKGEMDEAARRLNDAQARLEAMRKTAQLDLVQTDVTRQLNQRTELAGLTLDIEAEKARLKSAEEELAKQPPTNEGRSIVDTGTALAAARTDATAADRRKPAGGTPSTDAVESLRSDAISPYANPVYEVLRQQVALSRTRLAGLERRRAELAGGKLSGPQLGRLTEMYSRQLDIDRLEAEYETAKDGYTEAARRYNIARLQQAGLSIRLQRLDVAYPPDGPMPRHRARNAIIGGAAGVILSTVVVILLEMIAVLGASRPSHSKAGV